ncbi:MAG: GNAT family acetyltransferase [Chloroflexi bacterium]|nr:GNAT family acetyltransferase [Chloroflexota bacterium]
MTARRAPEAVDLRTFSFDEDWQAVHALWARCGPGVQFSRSDEPAEILKKLRRDPDLFLVAEQGGQVIGAVMGGYDGRRGLVYHLAVAPEVRRLGIGRVLMAELETRLREKGCLKSYLLVTKDNADVLAFYRELGWEVMDMHLMGKVLG